MLARDAGGRGRQSERGADRPVDGAGIHPRSWQAAPAFQAKADGQRAPVSHCGAGWGLLAIAVRQVGLDTGALRLADADFVHDRGWALCGQQALVTQIGHDAMLAILEAETGSGKTEAALWHFARLYAAGQVTGLYFAVPTRAAARQLHGRLCVLIRNLFGANAPEPVPAIPDQRVAGSAQGQALPDFVTVWDDAEGPLKSRTAAEHATRFLAVTIAVDRPSGDAGRHAGQARPIARCRSIFWFWAKFTPRTAI